MLKVFPDYRHAYSINGEIYLLGFDPSKLTEEGRALVEYPIYQVSYDQADTFTNTVTLQGRSIRTFSEQI